MVDNKQAFNAATCSQHSVLDEVRLLVVHCGVTDQPYMQEDIYYLRKPQSAPLQRLFMLPETRTLDTWDLVHAIALWKSSFSQVIVGGISNLTVSERALLSIHAHEHEISFSKQKKSRYHALKPT